jgi:hypothetical protein
MSPPVLLIGALTSVALLAGLKVVYGARQIRQRNFIRDYDWPPGLLDKLRAKHESFSGQNAHRVADGLRQFFLAYQMSGRKYVAMPSQVVDDLWHEFILYTRAYDNFCGKAFGGFFHHSPAQALAPARRQSNEGLRRVWVWCCRQENINPVRPARLPLLFALDAELNIANGFQYTTDCAQLRKAGVAAAYCGGDFADSSFDGSTAGFADSGGDSGHHGHGSSDGIGRGGGHGDSGGHSCGGHTCGGGSCGGGD